MPLETDTLFLIAVGTIVLAGIIYALVSFLGNKD